MLSPSPTQPPPTPLAPEKKPEQKHVGSTPLKKHMGQTPAALLVKSILRPFFKFLYYCIQGMRNHRILTFISLILLIGAVVGTSYFATRQTANSNGVQNPESLTVQLPQSAIKWLNAVRAGDSTALLAAQKDLATFSSPPDIATAIALWGERGNSKWTAIKLIGFSSPNNGTYDYFVEVDVTQTTNAGTQNVAVLWHFTTQKVVNIKDEILSSVDFISARPI